MQTKSTKKALILILTITIFFSSSCVTIILEDPDHMDPASQEPTSGAPGVGVMMDEDFTRVEFVQQGDIRIYYDPSVSNYVDDAGEFVPPASGDAAYSEPHPGYADFNFSPMQAHVYVADVLAYEEVADFAAGTVIDLYRVIEGLDVADPCVPELPLGTFYHECGHQEFISNMEVVNFINGGGVRYITVYAIQDFAPVDNRSLIYVFQGFTDDGKYYVKMIVEMMHAQLEGTGEIPAEIYAANDAIIFDAYFREYATIFEASEGEFTPDLNWIDSVLASLLIE